MRCRRFSEVMKAKMTVRESLAALGAFAGTAAVRCDVAAPAITGAQLLRKRV